MTENKKRTAAVIVAAGSSLRMGNDIKKQFLKVKAVPVLLRTLQSFEACDRIDEIVVVAKEEDVAAVRELAAEYQIAKLTAVVVGGATRAISAKLGFERIDPDMQYVAIHDGARCLVTPEEIERVCLAAYEQGAATAAVPVTDTVKRADESGFIADTLDRRSIFLAATPQIFSVELYRRALEAECIDFTDDNQLIELLPHPVKIVECSRDNIKITYPEDVSLAEFILNRREGLQ